MHAKTKTIFSMSDVNSRTKKMRDTATFYMSQKPAHGLKVNFRASLTYQNCFLNSITYCLDTSSLFRYIFRVLCIVPFLVLCIVPGYDTNDHVVRFT